MHSLFRLFFPFSRRCCFVITLHKTRDDPTDDFSEALPAESENFSVSEIIRTRVFLFGK
jgi:hypothetical protein